MKHDPDAMKAGREAGRTLARFVSRQQMSAILTGCGGEEWGFFQGKLIEMAAIIDAMPETYATDAQGDEAVAHLHYFVGGCNFFITEKDCEEEQNQAFGLADLGYGGELGYISIEEIISCGAELDLHWKMKTIGASK